MKAKKGDIWIRGDGVNSDPVVQLKLDGSRESLSQEDYDHLVGAIIRAGDEIGLNLATGFLIDKG